jgi:hypothetical protein
MRKVESITISFPEADQSLGSRDRFHSSHEYEHCLRGPDYYNVLLEINEAIFSMEMDASNNEKPTPATFDELVKRIKWAKERHHVVL